MSDLMHVNRDEATIEEQGSTHQLTHTGPNKGQGRKQAERQAGTGTRGRDGKRDEPPCPEPQLHLLGEHIHRGRGRKIDKYEKKK